MKKKIITLMLTFAMTAALMTGCGSKEEDKATEAPKATEEAKADDAADTKEEAGADDAAADDAAADDGAATDAVVADISSSLVGVWVDSDGEVFGFAEDNTYYVGSTTSDQEETGAYALTTDGEYVALALTFDSTGDVKTFYVQLGEDEASLVLINPETSEELALVPYTE